MIVGTYFNLARIGASSKWRDEAKANDMISLEASLRSGFESQCPHSLSISEKLIYLKQKRKTFKYNQYYSEVKSLF